MKEPIQLPAPLLEHPDVQENFAWGYTHYGDAHGEQIATYQKVLALLEGELSPQALMRERVSCERLHTSTPELFEKAAFLAGWFVAYSQALLTQADLPATGTPAKIIPLRIP
jgi:hypothetical protein